MKGHVSDVQLNGFSDSELPDLDALTHPGRGNANKLHGPLRQGQSLLQIYRLKELPWWPESKESDCNAGDSGSIPASGRSLREGNDNPH